MRAPFAAFSRQGVTSAVALLSPAASKSPGGISANVPPTSGEGRGSGQPAAGGAEPPGTIERHVRSRGPNSTATIAKARIAATSAIAARGRSSGSRVRTLLLRGNHTFRYGRRLPEDAGVTVFSLGTSGSQFM